MLKFFLGLLTGIILTALVLIILVFAAARLRQTPPHIAADSVLMLELEGDIPERPPVDIPIPLLGREGKPTIENIWTALRMAARDARIRAVVLEPRRLDIGWAKLEELRADLATFRKSGKPVFAFLRTPGAREYYLATAADRVYLGPQDWLDLKGMRAELMYFKNTLDKLGVSVQIVHAGKYKDFGDMFTRTSMSPETREVLNSVLDDLYGNLLARIGAARRKTAEQVRQILDQGPFVADQARRHGLVDELRFEDEMMAALRSRLKSGELKKLGLRAYLRVPPRLVGAAGSRRIALVVGEGAITGGGSSDDGFSEDGITTAGFTRLLRQAGSDGGIQGVIVRIDSPGGEVAASDEIWREMNLLSKKKPLVVSMSDVAASGGYYMAMTGDPVVAYPGTFTGSIGVVFGKPTLAGLYGKLGITKEILTRGRFADIDSDYSPLDATERAKVAQAIDAAYEDFVKKVAEARHMDFQTAEALSQGRVWLGSQAQPRKLVDHLGGLDRAVELVKQKARIPAGEEVTLVKYPPRRSIFELAFGRSGRQAWAAPPGLRLKWLHLPVWARGGLLRMMPYALEAR